MIKEEHKARTPTTGSIPDIRTYFPKLISTLEQLKAHGEQTLEEWLEWTERHFMK